MKKSKKICLAALLLIPALAFTACVPPPSYTITASTYGASWGRISGAETEEKEEGTKITMSAIELESENHPFICWIKDYKTVYSTKKDLELIYNEETKGHYTAVFHENSDTMLFATLSSITIENTSYIDTEYTINYSSSASGSNNYSTFAQGTLDPSLPFETDKSSVLYFGPLGSVIEYKFEMLMTFTDSSEEKQNYNLKFTNKIDENLFSSSTYSLVGTIADAGITITLNFEKISFDMYHTNQPEE